MAPSLIVAGFELLGGTTNPEYRLAPGFGFGEGDPDQTTITSLYLDGETVTGNRTGNRHMMLPLTVFTRNGSSLAVNVNALLQAVDAETFIVQWTPDGGLPVLFDAYRAKGVRPRDLRKDAQGQTALTLDFFAKPFGRSAGTLSVTAAAADTQLDSYATAPSGATLDTSVKFEGTGSAQVTLSSLVVNGSLRQYFTSPTVSRTYASAKNLTGMNAVTMRIRWPAPGPGALYANLTLISAAGNATIKQTKLYNAGATKWALVTFPLTGDLGLLDVTTVTGYSLLITTSPVFGGGTTSQLWVDDQRMRPPSGSLSSTTHAANLLLPGVVGSARTPVNLALANGSTFVGFLLHRPPADQDVDAQILTSLSGASADQTVTIAADNARLAGTYSIVLGVSTVGSGATTTTVTVTQKVNGTAVGSAAVRVRTYTAGPHLIPVGEVTLPLYAVPDDNTTTTYDFRVQASGTERYTELMLLDTRGQTVYTDTDLVSARATAYVDEPSTLQSASLVYSAVSGGRTAAFSAMGHVVTSGGPMLFEPGDNKVLAWVDTSTPSVTATYYPRWLDERVV